MSEFSPSSGPLPDVPAAQAGPAPDPLRWLILGTVGLAHRTDVPPTNAARAFQTTLLAFLTEAKLPAGVQRIR